MTMPVGFKPAKHQIGNAAFLAEWDRAALFDEPGTGKTASTMLALQALFPGGVPGNVLIVCPTSVTLMWERYIREWFPGATAIRHATTPKGQVSRACVHIASYDIVARAHHLLGPPPAWQVVILDESQMAKTWTSSRATALFDPEVGIATRAAFLWFLTGTPITRYVDDLFPLFREMAPTHPAARSIARFRRTFCIEELRRFGGRARTVVTGNNPDALRTLWEALDGTYRRTTLDDAVKGMPPVRVDVLAIEPSLEDRGRLWQGIKEVPGLADLVRMWANSPHPQDQLQALARALEGLSEGHTSKLRRILAEVKAAVALDYLVGEVEAQKVVVFVQHIGAMLEPLDRALRGHFGDDAIANIHGGTSPQQRSGTEARFNDDPALRCLIIQTRAGGVGLNLQQACRRVVEIEADWSGQSNLQAWARVARWGQTQPVHVTRLVLAKTIDEAVLAVTEAKLWGAEQVITPTEVVS